MKLNFYITFKKTLACDLFSLTCGVLVGEITLNEDCFASKLPMVSAEDVFIQVTSNPSLDLYIDFI